MTTSAPSPGAFSIIRTFAPGTQSSLRCSLTDAMRSSEFDVRPTRKAKSMNFKTAAADFRCLRWWRRRSSSPANSVSPIVTTSSTARRPRNDDSPCSRWRMCTGHLEQPELRVGDPHERLDLGRLADVRVGEQLERAVVDRVEAAGAVRDRLAEPQPHQQAQQRGAERRGRASAGSARRPGRTRAGSASRRPRRTRRRARARACARARRRGAARRRRGARSSRSRRPSPAGSPRRCRAAAPVLGEADDERTAGAGDVRRRVGRAVVDDEHVGLGQLGAGVGEHVGERLLLVPGGDEDERVGHAPLLRGPHLGARPPPPPAAPGGAERLACGCSWTTSTGVGLCRLRRSPTRSSSGRRARWAWPTMTRSQLPAARLAQQGAPGRAVADQLRHRDLLGDEPCGLLDVALSPLDQLLLELGAADREDAGSGADHRRGARCAAEEAEPAVARLDELHRARQRGAGGWAVIDPNENSVEHPWRTPSLLSALMSLAESLAR